MRNHVVRYNLVCEQMFQIAIHLDLGHLSMDRALDQKGGLPQKPQLQQAIGFYRVAHRQDPNSAEVIITLKKIV